MIAGLPKLKSSFFLLVFLSAVALVAAGQGVQTPSDIIDPVFVEQTPSVSLQPIYDAIALSPIATPEQIAALGEAFAAAVDTC